MRSILTCLLCISVLTTFAQIPPNNDCVNATFMPVQNGSCVVSAASKTAEATASTQTALNPSGADDDVWFKFTTGASGSPGTVKVVVNVGDVAWGVDVPQNIILELREGAATMCDNAYSNSAFLNTAGGSWILSNLNPSTDYTVRLYTDNNTSHIQGFGICVYVPTSPANDDCANATPITLSSNTGFVIQSAGTVGATASAQTSGDASGKDDDVWFSFTTPASTTNALVAISEQSYAGSGQPVIELWDNCGNATFVDWGSFTLSKNFTGLTPSTTYKVRVYTYGTSSRFITFKLTVTLSDPPPANDTYFTASLITLSSGTSCSTIVTGGTTVNATTEFPPACSGAASPPKDVWYKFIPAQATSVIELANVTQVAGSNPNMYMQLFRGSNTNSVLCSSTGSMNLDGTDVAHTLIPGTTYYLRIYNEDAGSSCTFNICNKVPPPPVNDECAGAINVPVNTGEAELKVSGTNVAATQSAPSLSCSGTAISDIWFKFVAPSTGQAYINISNFRALVNVGSGQPYWAVYNGTCGSLSLSACNLGPTGAISGLTAGTTYYIRVFDVPGNQYAFDISIRQVPATATNISCATATNLDGNWKQGSTLNLANASIAPCSGSPVPNKELWYSFTATATSHLIDFSEMIKLSANQNNLGYKVYGGTCGTLGTPVNCVDGVSFNNTVTTGLTIGQTYFVQVLEGTYNGGPMMFKIRSIPQAGPSNDQSTGATALIENPDCRTTAGTFKFADLGANPVSASYSADVWYKFKAASTDATITLSSYQYMVIYNSDATTIFTDPGFGGNSLFLAGMTVGNIYYIRLYNTSPTPSYGPDADFTICVSGSPSIVAADAPTPGSNCITIDGPATSTGSGTWLHLTHLGKMVASVMDTAGVSMGSIIGKYYINSGSVRSDAGGIEYLNRNFEITPAVQPVKPIAVRLYFTKAEFDAMVGANDGDGNDVYYLNDLKISKFSSNPCASTLTLSGEVLYNISNWGNLSTSVYYIEVIVPSFSSFFLKNISGVLPVSCLGLSAERKNNKIAMRWSTATESNSDHFEIQRSQDGRNFYKIGTVAAAGNSSAVINYSFVDEAVANKETYYYRLLAVDKNGAERFACNTAKVAAGDVKPGIFGNVYPNPVKGEMAVQLQRSYSGNVGLQIISATGQVMQQRSVNVQPSDVRITMNTSSLPKGVYILRLQTVEGVETIRFTRQ